MVCKLCGSALRTYPIVSITGMDTICLCSNCQAAEINKLLESNELALQALFSHHGVPQRYRNARLTKASVFMRDSDKVLDFKRGIYFFGESGTGKTWQMIAWFRYYLEHGYKVAYLDFSELICRWRTDMKTYVESQDAWLYPDAIFIDDFDTSNPYLYDYTYNMVKSMHITNKRVFFTSTSLPSQEKLAMRIGELTLQVELRNTVKG